MNICHVNLASGYHGGENQTLQLIKQQLKLGYNLTVVANSKSPFAEAVAKLDVKLVLINHFIRGHSKSVTHNCALIHVHEGRAIYWALIQNMLHGKPYIITRRIDNKLGKSWLANLAYSKSAAVIGLSSEIVNKIKEVYPSLVSYKIPSSPVSYPVNNKTVETIKKRFADKFLVIHAANMLQHKGFNITVGAAKLLQSSAPSIHICLLGDGIERQSLELQAEGLTNISFEGEQSNMGDWFTAADLQVHPSYSEGLGSVLLEGMEAGLPIIATNAGGIPDIIEHNVTGLLIEAGNSQELAEAIIRVSEDEKLRENFVKNGQEKLKLFDILHASNQYSEIYKKVLK